MLRVPTDGDVPDLQRWCADWEVARWTANIPHPYSRQDAEKFVEGSRESIVAARAVALAVVRKTEPGLIGVVGLTLDALAVEGDLGWWIAPPHQGQGYATEAAAALVELARAMGVARLTAGTLPDNGPSQAVCRKLGMRPAGKLLRAAPARGAPNETLEFVLTG